MTYTFNIIELSEVAVICSLAQVRPVSITFGDTNVSIEFTGRDDAIRFTEEYLGSSENVSDYVS